MLMKLGNRLRLAHALPIAAAALCAGFAAPASASAATLELSADSSSPAGNPEVGYTETLSAAGDFDADGDVLFYVQRDDAACAATADAEAARDPLASSDQFVSPDDSGAYSTQYDDFSPSTAGRFRVCAYLYDGLASHADPPAASDSLVLDVPERAATLSLAATGGDGKPVSVTATGTDETAVDTLAVYVEKDATSCAPTANQEADRPGAIAVIGGEAVPNGSFSFTGTFVPDETGGYLLCGYVYYDDGSDDPPAKASAHADATVTQLPPPPDGDNDGVPDANDQCPTQPGVTAWYGCPAPSDQDADGFPDVGDLCPSQAAPGSAFGCPQGAPDATQTVNDPGGDWLTCVGECPLVDQDLKSVTINQRGGDLEFRIEGYNPNRLCLCYYPEAWLFTHSTDASNPDYVVRSWADYSTSQYHVGLFDGPGPSAHLLRDLCQPAGRRPPLGAVPTAGCGRPSDYVVAYDLSLSELGNPPNLRWLVGAPGQRESPGNEFHHHQDRVPDNGTATFAVANSAAQGGGATGPTPRSGSAAGSPGSTSTSLPRIAPALTNSVAKKRRLVVTATCAAPCTSVRGTGTLAVGAKRYSLAPVAKPTSGRPVTLAFNVPKRVAQAVNAALARHKKPTATIKVAALDARGQVLGSSRGTIHLRRSLH